MKSINLLPPKKNTSSQNPKLLPLLLVITILLLGAQMFYYTSWSAKAKEAEQEVVRLDQQIKEISANGDLKVKVDGYKQAEQMIEQLQNSRQEWKPYLKVIIGYLPSATKIVSIDAQEETKLKMELDFKEGTEIITYLKKLERADELKDVKATSYFKKVDDQETSESVPSTNDDGIEIKKVRKEVYKLMLDIELSQDKGAQ